MNEWLSKSADANQELHDLIESNLFGKADVADRERLQRLIVEDPEASTLYIRYIEETAGLQVLASENEKSTRPHRCCPV